MQSISSALLALVLFLQPAAALVVGSAGASPAVRTLQQVQAVPLHMKSQEDKEFEEWVRKKKIASGVDPDEDFAAGRAQERSIFQVGGAPPVL